VNWYIYKTELTSCDGMSVKYASLSQETNAGIPQPQLTLNANNQSFKRSNYLVDIRGGTFTCSKSVS
jgi:hypothetical protein